MKKYIGKGHAGKFDIVNFSICLTDIPKDEIKIGTNGKKYLRLCLGKMKDTDNWGNTHTVWVDDFKPEKKEVPDEDLF